MKRSVLLVALTLVVAAAGQARGDMVISADFVGLSDRGAYSVDYANQFLPLPPSPIQAGFTYTDDGTATTLSVFFGRLGWSFPPSTILYSNGDTFFSITFKVSDVDRAAYPLNPIDSEFQIGADRTLTLDFTKDIMTLYGSRFIISGATDEASELKGTLHLLPDNTVDPSSISLYGFTGGEFAYIGGPLTQLVPEPSTLALFGTAAATFAGCIGWRRRKHATA